MDYNFNKAISSIHNIICSLNKGGTFNVRQIADDLWEEAPEWKQAQKISKPSDSRFHTEEYARRQVRQEIRRSLYDYFNNIEDRHYEVYRATPLGGLEIFWLAEIQYAPDETVEESLDPVDVVVHVVESLGSYTPFFDKLLESKNEIASLSKGLYFS